MNIEENIKPLKILMSKYKQIDEMNNFDHELALVIDYTELLAIETLLTAYEKEKETSHYIQSQLDIANAKLVEEKEKNKKIKWKPIKDYDRKKYDWVLVKYFDGDYECVPEVAEKRNDGKWYTSEKQIPFEVKYFFDMQEILEEE